jgi:hypothetical protein
MPYDEVPLGEGQPRPLCIHSLLIHYGDLLTLLKTYWLLPAMP